MTTSNTQQPIRAKLNKRERRAQQLLAHYATCERLAAYLGKPGIDGKKISVALWKAEKLGTTRSERLCSDASYTYEQQGDDKNRVLSMVANALGNHSLPPGFFINSDPLGYALKIDNETPEGLALIEAVGLHKDMGGYGCLSPEIDGN